MAPTTKHAWAPWKKRRRKWGVAVFRSDDRGYWRPLSLAANGRFAVLGIGRLMRCRDHFGALGPHLGGSGLSRSSKLTGSPCHREPWVATLRFELARQHRPTLANP